MKFAFSPDADCEIVHLGRENQPLAIIDNAAADPALLVEDAAMQRFSKIGPFYPGVRSALSDEFTSSLCDSIRPILTSHFGVSHKRWDAECFYSIVTTPPEKLLPIQRLPHYDGIEDDRIAILLYLSKPEQGGTSFYRHISSGFELINAERFENYKSALENEVRQHGLPVARYIEDGAPLFKRIKLVDAVFNRMLIYRGVNLHCSDIPNPGKLSADARNGRLTVNAFLNPQEQK